MKKILLFIVILSGIIFLLNSSYSDENNCKQSIQDKVNKCVSEKNKRSIEDFVCIEGTRENITYQIVLDEKFSKIDKEIDDYLTELETQKSKYFGPEAISNYINASDEIEKKFSTYGEYWEKYNNLCGVDIISEVMDCQNGKTSNKASKDFFDESKCISLAYTKLYIYSQVAYDILMVNKLNVRQDSAKVHLQEQRKKYDEVLDAMMTNAGYMERIGKKWPSKLKNTH